jgi:hypothetical protein
MVKIFKLEIDKIVYGAIKGAGGLVAGTLIKTTNTTRDPLNLTGGLQPTTTNIPFEGIIEQKIRILDDGVTGVSESHLSILGASLTVVPEVDDSAVFEGRTYKLVELLEVDPANALYKFKVS